MTALAAVMEAGIGQKTDTSGSCDRAAWTGLLVPERPTILDTR